MKKREYSPAMSSEGAPVVGGEVGTFLGGSGGGPEQKSRTL